MHHYLCFPSIISFDKIELPENKVLEQLTNDIKNITFHNTNSDGSNNTYVSECFTILKKYPELEKEILNKFNLVNQNIYDYSCDFKITTSWLTKVEQNSFSQRHNHNNSFYSGVLYFGDNVENNSKIQFYNPNIKIKNFYITPRKWNDYNCNTFVFTPEKNMILFFPSYLEHEVMKQVNRSTRYSLAFNIVPYGEYGMGDSFYSTEWFK